MTLAKTARDSDSGTRQEAHHDSVQTSHRERESWIDRLKGWSILLVVIGHNVSLNSEWHEGIALLYLFHVPLFFIVAGLTLRPDAGAGRMFERSLSLVWVYFGVGALFLTRDIFESGGDVHAITQAMAGLLYGTGLTIRPVPMWFLPCLALTLLMVHFSLAAALRARLASRLTTMSVLAATWFALGTLAVSQENSVRVAHPGWGNAAQSGWFWSADIALLGAGYVFIGLMLKGALDAVDKRGVLGTGLGAAALFGVVVFIGQPAVDLNLRVFDPAIPALLASISGALALIACARGLGPLPLDDFFTRLGQATLPVLAFHNPIQNLVSQLGQDQSPLWTGLAGVALAVSIPMLLDFWVLSRTWPGRWIFYPRKAFNSWRNRIQPRGAS